MTGPQGSFAVRGGFFRRCIGARDTAPNGRAAADDPHALDAAGIGIENLEFEAGHGLNHLAARGNAPEFGEIGRASCRERVYLAV